MIATKCRILACLLALGGAATAQVPDLYDPDTYRDFYLQFNQPDYWTQLTNNYASKTNIAATLIVDGVTYANVGARFRGNTSYRSLPAGSQKKSFNISMDAFVPGQDLYGYDNLNLNNGFHDPTFMREFMAYMISRRHGIAPKCNFIRLWINNEYWGVYINAQQPNKDMMKEWLRSNDGNRYRGYPTSGSFNNGRTALTWLGSDPAQYLAAYEAKQGDGTDLRDLCNILNNTPTAQLRAALEPVFSVDQFFRYAATMNAIVQNDSYIGTGKDHFLWVDELHGAFHMFPFDLNESFGAEGGSATMDPLQNSTNAQRPALSKTLQFPELRQRYLAHYRTILEETFSWAELGPIINQYHSMIANDVVNDTKKIYTTQQFFDNLTQTVIGPGVFGNSSIPGLQPLIQQRETYLWGRPEFQGTRVTLSDLQHTPVNPTPQDSVCINVTASPDAIDVKLFYRSDTPFQEIQMFDDGLNCDGAANDGVWGVVLPAAPPGTQFEYYARAMNIAEKQTFLPNTAELFARQYRVDWLRGTSPIQINEFVAQNNNGIVDEAGQHEDWIELHNASSQPVDVSGMYVSDDFTQVKWPIPAGYVIPPDGTLLIWCDEDGSQGPLHANFKLASSSEEILLFLSDGVTLVDHFPFGPQVSDVATGRLFDGGGPFVTFTDPTPDASNELPGCGSRDYGALDPRQHVMRFSLSGSPQIGTSPNLIGAGGLSGGAAHLFLAAAPSYIDLSIAGNNMTLLVDPGLMVGPFVLPLNVLGSVILPLPIPNDPAIVGATLYAQGVTIHVVGLTSTNAVEIMICP